VDPGTWRTGAGIIESEGSRYRFIHAEVITVKQKLPIADRLLQIYQALTEMTEKFKPEVLALENVFYGKDLQAMVKIGEARACAMLAASGHGIEVVEYPPARVKQSVSGNGRATKEQVQHMVKTLLNLPALPPEDSSDALAVAICHAHMRKGISNFQFPISKKSSISKIQI
jgi:crossover junction endodeoxyribonuclease RuvC